MNNNSLNDMNNNQSNNSVQPIQNTNSLVNKLNIVNPLNPNEIIKIEELIENNKLDSKEANIENNNLESKQINNNIDNIKSENKLKRKINKFIIPLVLCITIIVIVILYFVFFNKSNNVPSPTPNNQVDNIETKITLNDIVNKFNNHSGLQNLKTLGYNCVAKVIDNKIIVDVNKIDIENTEDVSTKQYIFTLENRSFKFLDNNDDIYYNLYLIIMDSIGMLHGLEENEVISLLNSVDLTVTNIDGITIVQTENGTEITINIDKKIDTSSLKTMYIEINDLKEQESFLKESGTAIIEKGNLKLYKQGDEKTTTIVIAEKNNLSNLTYNTILSLIEFLYPNEIDNFKTSYPKLTTISFNRYVITENPLLDEDFKNYFEQYKNDYKFIEIKINKDA